MGWLNFVVEMTRALAWPVAVTILAFVFRRTLRALLERILSLKWGSWEAAFAAEGARVAEQIGQSNVGALAAKLDDKALLALAEQSPRAAIVEAALQIEILLRELAADKVADIERRPPAFLIDLLERGKVIDQMTARSLRGLYVMRNLAVHSSGAELTVQKAVEFITLATAIMFVLKTKLNK